MPDEGKESHELFHSFCIRPKLHFETQSSDEKVILVLRKHPITQLPWIFNSLVFIIILLAIDILVGFLFTPGQLVLFNVFLIVFIAAYVYFNILSFFFNVGIVTNKRVIDIDFHVIIYKEFTASRLDRIEDITSKTGGYFSSFFNYGDVFLQTAGTEANIEFHSIPRPQQVTTIINQLVPH